MTYVDFSKFIYLEPEGGNKNSWRVKLISSFFYAATQELFLMTKPCLAEAVTSKSGGIFTGLYTHEFSAVIVLNLKTRHTKWIGLRNSLGLRPYAQTEMWTVDKDIISRDIEQCLLSESEIKKYDFNTVNSMMHNFSQTKLVVRCKMPNGDELMFPLEYNNFTMQDNDQYMQPIHFPSIFVSQKRIYQGAFAIHYNREK